MAASFVLASLGGATYGKEYALPPRSLRSRWTTILSILHRRGLAPPSEAVPVPALNEVLRTEC